MLEMLYEHDIYLYFSFGDFRQDFNSVNWNDLYKMLECILYASKNNIISKDDYERHVKVNNKLREEFKLNIEVG